MDLEPLCISSFHFLYFFLTWDSTFTHIHNKYIMKDKSRIGYLWCIKIWKLLIITTASVFQSKPPDFLFKSFILILNLKSIVIYMLLQIGRPVIFGLAAKGEYGVRQVIQMLKDELEITMALAGCRSVKDITRRHVRTERERLHAML